MIKSLVKRGLLLIALLIGVQPILISQKPLQSNYGMVASSKTLMRLTLTRTSHSKHGTFGVLRLDGRFVAYTLEETELQIPPGTYPVELTFSPHFHRLLPLLSVPHRSAIRIHAGNWPRDSSGCVLVGQIMGKDMILKSDAALDILIPQIQQELSSGGVVQLSVS